MLAPESKIRTDSFDVISDVAVDAARAPAAGRQADLLEHRRDARAPDRWAHAGQVRGTRPLDLIEHVHFREDARRLRAQVLGANFVARELRSVEQ